MAEFCDMKRLYCRLACLVMNSMSSNVIMSSTVGPWLQFRSHALGLVMTGRTRAHFDCVY